MVPYESEVPYSRLVNLSELPPSESCGIKNVYQAFSEIVPDGTSISSNKYCLEPL